MSALAPITAKRTWLVHDLTVWGTGASSGIELLLAESPTATGELYFNTAEIGNATQSIEFSQLTDHRGNPLPSTISAPHVIVRAHSTTLVHLVGRETDSGFKIARDSDSPDTVTVDVVVIEMGE